MKYILTIALFIFLSCNQKSKVEPIRYFGVIEDNIEAPVVMSEGYRTMTLRGKPKPKPKPVDTTVIIVPPPTPTTGGYQIPMPPVISQGSEGSCVSFAIGYYIRSSYTSTVLSPEYLFNLSKTDLNCQGSTLLNNLNVLKEKGICTNQSMPYSSINGCALIPSESQNAEAANYKITSYAVVYTSDQAAIKALLNSKNPLYISFNVDNSFYYAGPTFIWRSFSGTVLGQHAVAIVGYDDARHAWKIVNSWGTGWGDAGYSWIDYDFLPQVSAAAMTIKI